MATLLRIVTGVIALLLACTIAAGDPNISVQNKICNPDTNESLGYFAEIDNLLDDVVMSTPDSGFNYYGEQNGYPVHTCYGHGKCNVTLSPADCYTCLLVAKVFLRQTCAKSVGAQVQLTDCRMRYEKYAFNEG